MNCKSCLSDYEKCEKCEDGFYRTAENTCISKSLILQDCQEYLYK